MPRSGWQKPETDQRLSDHLTIAMLTTSYPPHVVEEAIAATGRGGQRQRLLPPRVVLYYVLAMAVFAEASYEEVLRRLLEGLAWQQRWATTFQAPTKAAIFKARNRLGVEPLIELHRRAVRPLTTAQTRGARYRGRPVITVDRLDLVLSGASSSAAGRGAGATARPEMLPVTALVEAVSHVALAVTLERSPAAAQRSLDAALQPGALYVVSAHSGTRELHVAATERASDLLWASDRVATLADPDAGRVLADGSRLVHITDESGGRSPRRVRVIENSSIAEAPAGPSDAPMASVHDSAPDRWLLTTLLDPAEAPSEELRDIYARRATILSCLEDLRTHQQASNLVPRSQSVDGAAQELYGLLLAHYAIRSLLIRRSDGS